MWVVNNSKINACNKNRREVHVTEIGEEIGLSVAVNHRSSSQEPFFNHFVSDS